MNQYFGDIKFSPDGNFFGAFGMYQFSIIETSSLRELCTPDPFGTHRMKSMRIIGGNFAVYSYGKNTFAITDGTGMLKIYDIESSKSPDSPIVDISTAI